MANNSGKREHMSSSYIYHLFDDLSCHTIAKESDHDKSSKNYDNDVNEDEDVDVIYDFDDNIENIHDQVIEEEEDDDEDYAQE